jgi:hypothetical protein
MTKPKCACLIAATLFVCAQISSATVVFAVGTKSGVLVCEDTRITRTDQDGKKTYIDDHKAQRLGDFGFSTVAGALSYYEQPRLGTTLLGPSPWSYDIPAQIRTFFGLNDIRRFDDFMAGKFETSLQNEFRKSLLATGSLLSVRSPRLVEVFLYWIDPLGQPKVYCVDLTDMWTLPSLSFSTTPQARACFIHAFRDDTPYFRTSTLLNQS